MKADRRWIRIVHPRPLLLVERVRCGCNAAACRFRPAGGGFATKRRLAASSGRTLSHCEDLIGAIAV